MAEDSKRQNLGRGLSALLGDVGVDAASEPEPHISAAGSNTLPVETLRPSRYQPRHFFDEDELKELADSIRENGILQPILVRPTQGAETDYEIIAGERRWRAAQLAQLHEVPVTIRDLTDLEALELALVENLQREDLSALEEAEGYSQLMKEFNHTQELLARSVGKSRSHVANMLRLLNLPDAVKALLNSRELSAGHARALLNAADPIGLAKTIVKRGLNVRQTEKLVSGSGDKPNKSPKTKDPNTAALEHDVSTLLGLAVSINTKTKGGTISIAYESLEQLDEILHRLSQGAHGHPISPAEDPLDEALNDPVGESFREEEIEPETQKENVVVQLDSTLPEDDSVDDPIDNLFSDKIG
ncbi:MAG: ParB/RepB/Spo0J family partition protein [Proteobacteria bacterium]|nr:ParB/RepB/Spo0J family partition protein [Pseudomonadota bacterium]